MFLPESRPTYIHQVLRIRKFQYQGKHISNRNIIFWNLPRKQIRAVQRTWCNCIFYVFPSNNRNFLSYSFATSLLIGPFTYVHCQMILPIQITLKYYSFKFLYIHFHFSGSCKEYASWKQAIDQRSKTNESKQCGQICRSFFEPFGCHSNCGKVIVLRNHVTCRCKGWISGIFQGIIAYLLMHYIRDFGLVMSIQQIPLYLPWLLISINMVSHFLKKIP